MIERWVLSGLLIICSCASAEEPSVTDLVSGLGRGTLNLYFENDLFAETDQNYTNGIRVSLISPDLENFQQEFIDNRQIQQLFDVMNPLLEQFHPEIPGEITDETAKNSRRIVLSLGQTIYTPETSEASELLEDERPYAGWLFLGVAYHARNRNRLRTVGVNFGMVGPAALGQEAQDLIHELRGFSKFQGWDNQLKNEPGVQLLYEYKNKLIDNTEGFGYDLISHYGGSLGNIATYANVGAEIRAGWNIPDDFGTSALRPGGDNSAPDGEPRSGLGFHLFASSDIRLVARDIFLDGNTFRDSHSVSKEPVVADVALGASLVYDSFKLSFAQVIRSKGFRGQKGNHNYGSLSLSWNFTL
ncbi:lipid A deacylase LpxR family protein [Motiliproteus sp. MSK22-1]|uniref:lipid A deacylase LpxR family protein n=1 Tax=Motiliproteus sp. MSK22-1 TaxID=1897630 RepID=UPI0009773B30|nr:lipid A deacylase LpxR family protein [Motiliproteus sp. MSK22-1]OMH32164.1 hypothetical protein BGP75_15825 [Motiliproteus sp. MSK22-1]